MVFSLAKLRLTLYQTYYFNIRPLLLPEALPEVGVKGGRTCPGGLRMLLTAAGGPSIL